MKKQDFFYELPEDRIAQEPVEPRDHSRMLVLDRKTGTFEDRHFYDVLDYLREGDCLVLNDSRVLPARLYGEKLGLAFQIQDDILDVIGDSRELGKATGSDAQNHKQTYVTLHGLEESGREVERLTGEAVAVLDGFSGEHEFLKELLLHLVHRTK